MEALTLSVLGFNVQKISDQVKASPEWLAQIQKGQESRPGYFFLAVELYSLICSNPAPLDSIKPEHLWAKTVHECLDSHGIIEMMQRQTSAHPTLALGAVFSILTKLDSFIPAPKVELPDMAELRKQYVEAQAQGLNEYLEELKKQAAEAKKAYEADAAMVEHRVSSHQVKVELDQVTESNQLQVDAFSFLCPAGFEQSELSWHDATTLSQQISTRMKGDRRLEAIIRAAGRIRRRLDGDGAESPAPGMPGAVDGVTTTGDPSDALAEEFARLTSAPGVFYIDAMNDELAAQSTVGETPKHEGPVVICLDKSASMSGANEIWAKGVMLNAIRNARESGRDVSVIQFDMQSTGATAIPADMEAAAYTAAITRLCNISPSGGTDFAPPLDDAIEAIRNDSRMGEADVLFITDGQGELEDDWKAEYLEAKEELGFEVFGVMINEAPQFRHLCLLEDIKAECQRTQSGEPIHYLQGSTAELIWLSDRGAIVTITNDDSQAKGADAFLKSI
jgi:uncharacterized protein with von Willebrand factor type A (vWA) domain